MVNFHPCTLDSALHKHFLRMPREDDAGSVISIGQDNVRLFGCGGKLRSSGKMLARIEHLNRDNAAFGIVVEHDTLRHLLAFDDASIGEAHVKRVTLRVIKRLHYSQFPS